MICTEIEVEGVSDYHGSKENWYISCISDTSGRIDFRCSGRDI